MTPPNEETAVTPPVEESTESLPQEKASAIAARADTNAIQLKRLLLRNRPVLYAYGLLVTLALVGEIITGGFLAPSHIDEMIITGAFIAFVALGQTFAILSGGIDLSIPWVLNSASVLLTLWAHDSSLRMIWLVPVLLAGGALIGLVNGVGVALLRIPPIIMTLGMSSVVEGGLLL